MTRLGQLYHSSLTLLTDLYQLTMAYGYWRTGLAGREAVFHLTFRHCPFDGQFALACGLSNVVDFLHALRFTADDLAYLASLQTAQQQPLFANEFLEFLAGLQWQCDLDAVPEGTVVFANEPLVRVRGPLLQTQLLETPLLNLLNFPTLVATKAARVCRAAGGQPVLEFGLRRAQGIDGGVTASRAAYVGGCAGTSNLLAGKLFGIPVKGTHAHSWVSAHDNELAAFQAYAAVLPDDCVFLVDTYDTLQGVRHAIQVARQLREQGHRLVGIRLDSGDFLTLSRQARVLLDEAGLAEAAIVASGDLDEFQIAQLRQQGAAIDVWGVGTRLVTAYDQPALGGIYKLAALHDADGRWSYRIKLSEDGTKMSDPGILQVRRWQTAEGRFLADVVYDELQGCGDPPRFVPHGSDSPTSISAAGTFADLLVPIVRRGRPVYEPPAATVARARVAEQLRAVDEAILRLERPQPYPVGVEERLHSLRQELICRTRAATRR